MINDIGVYSVKTDNKIRLNSNENPNTYSIEEIKNIINSKNIDNAGICVPPTGLTLEKVYY